MLLRPAHAHGPGNLAATGGTLPGVPGQALEAIPVALHAELDADSFRRP